MMAVEMRVKWGTLKSTTAAATAAVVTVVTMKAKMDLERNPKRRGFIVLIDAGGGLATSDDEDCMYVHFPSVMYTTLVCQYSRLRIESICF
jgi:hypothetical protein